MKVVRGILCLAAAAALLSGCSTLPPPDKGNKTLLVIAVKLATPGTYALAYEFGLKESETRLPVNPQNGILFYEDLPPGSYTIDRVFIMLGPGAAGGSLIGGPQMDRISPLGFKLTEGLITILPSTVLVGQESRADRTMQGWTWIPTNRQEVLSKLAAYDNFARWKVAE